MVELVGGRSGIIGATPSSLILKKVCWKRVLAQSYKEVDSQPAVHYISTNQLSNINSFALTSPLKLHLL